MAAFWADRVRAWRPGRNISRTGTRSVHLDLRGPICSSRDGVCDNGKQKENGMNFRRHIQCVVCSDI